MPSMTLAPEPPRPDVVPAAPARPGAVTRALSWARSKPFAQRRLRSALSNIVSMAHDHEANGLPAGHEHYRSLYELACVKADAYAKLRGITSERLEAELASLEVLRRLAHPGAQRLKLGATVGIASIVLIPIAAGMASGMIYIGYRWVLHLFGVH